MKRFDLLIADAYPAHLKRLAEHFLESGRFNVLPPVRSGNKAFQRVLHGHVDAVLADLTLPGTDGLRLLQELKALAAPPLIFLISALDIEPFRELALKLGALQFFTRDTEPEVICGSMLRILDATGN